MTCDMSAFSGLDNLHDLTRPGMTFRTCDMSAFAGLDDLHDLTSPGMTCDMSAFAGVDDLHDMSVFTNRMAYVDHANVMT